MKNIKIFIIFSFLFCSILTNFLVLPTYTSISQSHEFSSENTYSLKSTNLLADGNSQLQAIATSGSGIKSDPYVIQNLAISNCNVGESGVSINNTDQYLLISNVNVTKCHSGFSFYNVSNVVIQNAQSLFNNFDGFYLFNTTNFNLTTSISNNNTENGLVILNSVLFNITDNFVTFNGQKGIYFKHTDNSYLINNSVKFNNIGIYLYSVNGELDYNTGLNNTHQDISTNYCLHLKVASNNLFSTNPTVPLNFTLVNGTSFIFLKWDRPLSDGYAEIQDYYIYRSSGGLFQAKGVTSSLFFNDTQVVENSLYVYYVAAYNKNGLSPYTKTLSGKVLSINTSSSSSTSSAPINNVSSKSSSSSIHSDTATTPASLISGLLIIPLLAYRKKYYK